MTRDQYLSSVRSALSSWDIVTQKMNDREKLLLAQDLQSLLDWCRFRAKADKECFSCRHKNEPDAKTCVKCGGIFVCEKCPNETWACAHRTAFKLKELPKKEKPAKPERPAVIKEPEPKILKPLGRFDLD